MIRTFTSIKPFKNFTSLSPIEISYKPIGLWYSPNFEWLDWCINVCRIQYKYFYEIKVNEDKIYIINNIDELEELEYKYIQYGVYGGNMINWKLVAKDWCGIEIIPYLSEYRLEKFWYYPWDVASGCVWGEAAIASITEVKTQKVKNKLDMLQSFVEV